MEIISSDPFPCWKARKDLQRETKKKKQMGREAVNSRKNKNLFKNLMIAYYLSHQNYVMTK